MSSTINCFKVLYSCMRASTVTFLIEFFDLNSEQKIGNSKKLAKK